MIKKLLLLVGCLLLKYISAQVPIYVKDITDPESKVADALCSPLHTVTICTANLDSTKLFYVKGMGMTLVGPIAISKQVIKFYTEVLGMEKRKDTEWRTGEGSALGLEPNVPFRFTIVYAKGAKSGHLLFLDYKDNKRVIPNAAPRLPNRGIGMFSFSTKNIKTIYNRAKDAGVKS